MSGIAIGKTLPLGYRGAVTRSPDTIIAPYVNCGASNIEFGEPVVFDATNKGVRRVASTDSATDIIGIAVRRIGQPYADSNDGWYYKSKDIVDVLLRGSIAVEIAATASIAARGGVYVCDGTQTGESAGDIKCASATGRFQMPNAVFTTGNYDSANIAEVTILTRSI